jgi:hypothetical protein
MWGGGRGWKGQGWIERGGRGGGELCVWWGRGGGFDTFDAPPDYLQEALQALKQGEWGCSLWGGGRGRGPVCVDGVVHGELCVCLCGHECIHSTKAGTPTTKG